MDPQKRVQEAIEAVMGGTERTKMRPLQRDVFMCMARCCSDTESSQSRVQECMQRCGMPMKKAEQVVTEELKKFQGRLQRCAMNCQDKLRDKIPINATLSASQEAALKSEGMACVNSCVDDHLKVLPTVNQRVRDVIDQMAQQVPQN
jgi:hypothetical protein